MNKTMNFICSKLWPKGFINTFEIHLWFDNKPFYQKICFSYCCFFYPYFFNPISVVCCLLFSKQTNKFNGNIDDWTMMMMMKDMPLDDLYMVYMKQNMKIWNMYDMYDDWTINMNKKNVNALNWIEKKNEWTNKHYLLIIWGKEIYFLK